MKDNDSRRKIGIFGSVPIYALPLINSVNEMKALTGISSFQGANDKAFPSIPVIAERIGLSESATSTAISGLVRKGLVGRKRNYGKSNTYFLLYETESMAQIKLQNKEEKKKERAKRLLENIEIYSKRSQLLESLEYSKVSKHENSNSSNIDYSNSSNDILKEQNKRTELKEQSSFPSQDKVTLFFEHHKKQLMQTRKHGDPDLHLVDKLGTLIEWDIETYDKILKAKQNSTWEVRRNQPNTAKWLLATMENENLESVKSNVVTFPKYDLEELRKEGFV